MESVYTIATKKALLNKQQQLDLWQQFQELLFLLKDNDLGYCKTSVDKLWDTADKKGKILIRKALKAKDELVATNMRMAITWAKHIEKGYGVALEDGINVAIEGIVKALVRFDPTKGTKFSSYAAFWIKCYCLNYAKSFKIPNRVYFVEDDCEAGLTLEAIADGSREDVIDRILTELPEERRDLLVAEFGLNPSKDDAPLLKILLSGMTEQEYSEEIKLAISHCKEIYYSLYCN